MNAPERAVQTATQMIPLQFITASLTNPRKRFDEAQLGELTESVKRHGVLQPILVRSATSTKDPRVLWELVAGERRYRAAKAAGLEDIPAVVRSLTDIEALEVQVIENLQRADLHPIEEAEGYEHLLKLQAYTAEDLAAKVGKSKAYVYARLKLTALCPEARQAFYADNLTPSTALLIARIPGAKLQAQVLKEITNEHDPLSYRDAARLIHDDYMLRLKDATFDIKDATLLPKAGACGACPKRTGNQPELFGDVKSADVCTDPQCFAAKKEVGLARLRKKHEDAGRKVIAGVEAKKLLPNEWSEPKGYYKADKPMYDVESGNGNYPKAIQLAKKLDVETTLVEHPKTKELIELVPTGALQAAMKKAGLTKSSSSGSSYSAAESAAAKKAKLETAVRARILDAIHASPSDKFSRDDWIRIAHAFYGDIWNEYRKRILALWGWTEVAKAGSYPDDEKDPVLACISALANEELVRFLLDCALIKQVHIGPYAIAKCDQLEAAAVRRGIDVEAIRAEAKAQASVKTKKVKKSKKTAAKPRATKPKKEKQ